jgi:hypothetical protein
MAIPPRRKHIQGVLFLVVVPTDLLVHISRHIGLSATPAGEPRFCEFLGEGLTAANPKGLPI